MKIIDGKSISQELRRELKKEVEDLKKQGIEPGLATILVGDDPASQVYVKSKIKDCAELGINSFHNPLPASAGEKDIISLIEKLNSDGKVHGILLQLPLPKGTPQDRCLESINPEKDADGLHPFNLGKLAIAKSWAEIEEQRLLAPCTPLGVMELLERSGVEISGKNAVVVGRSNLVGKPVALLLLSKNATVTMAHSRTKDLQEVCRKADILIAAIGKERFITKDFIKPGSAVIDVGINRSEKGLVGDVDFDSVKDFVSAITPVPGGVGPMTRTMLMKNTILAARKQGK